mgnify:FL=1
MTTAETMETQATPATNPESEVAQESSASTPVAAPEKSFDEMSDMEALEYSLSHMSTDQHVKGYVLAVTPTEIQVDIGRKHAGYVPIDEYSADPDVKAKDEVKVGDILDLIVMRTNDQEGTVMLSKKRYDASAIWENFCASAGTDDILTGKVTEVVKGGILVMSKGIRVFIPASQATASRGESLEELLHQTVKFRILEVNRQRHRAVGSIRSVLRDERKEQEAEFWNNIEEGKVYTGKVKSLTSYGAFVDLGGVDGMVHISELSWRRIKNPSEVVSVGDVIEVYVKSFDAEKRRVSLGYKKAEDNPWSIFLRDYKEGDVVKVKIVSMTAYGAFANIIEGIDGLIHISQISHDRIAKPQDVLTVGQEVEAKITQIDTERKRISLSIKALTEPDTAAEEDTAEEAPAEEAPVEETAAEETAE